MITQTYDARNRMLAQVYPISGGSSTITNTYDIMGRVLTTSEGGTSLSYSYDALGRNLTFTDQAGRESTYTYDLDGHRVTSAYPTGEAVQRVYDSSNRLTELQQVKSPGVIEVPPLPPTITTMATYSYDILDRVAGVTLANGTSVSYGYDLLNRVTSVNNTTETDEGDYSYVYDNANRVTQVTEPRGMVTSGYTDRNEVNSITEPSGSPFDDQAFVYDAGFNRSSICRAGLWARRQRAMGSIT